MAGAFEDLDFNLEDAGAESEDAVGLRLTGTWDRMSDSSVLLNVDFAGTEETLNLRVRSESNPVTLTQFYNWASQEGNLGWTDQQPAREEYWSTLSEVYWNAENWSDGRLNGFDPTDQFDKRFDFASDKEELDDWDRSRYAADGLTSRGWVFGVEYEGDSQEWDVEETRDELKELRESEGETDPSADLRLFEEYADETVPESSEGCANLL